MLHIFYHRNCRDGQFAAWACLSAVDDYTLHDYGHAESIDIDQLKGQDVVFVDIAPTLANYHAIRKVAKTLTVLDHHKTAVYLSGLPGCVIEKGKSGARLAWEYYHPHRHAPHVLNYVEDRDLWRWQLCWSREINAGMRVFDFSPLTVTKIKQTGIYRLREMGQVILQHQKAQVAKYKKTAMSIKMSGRTVPCVQCNDRDILSDLGAALAVDQPFAAMWVLHEPGVVRVSLRSNKAQPDAMDVSKIAQLYDNGGGHKHAAGCFMTVEEFFKRLS